MMIIVPSSHPKKKGFSPEHSAHFQAEELIDIRSLTEFQKVANILKQRTKNDGIARILCSGNKIEKSRTFQRRLFIVKKCHGKQKDKIWSRTYPDYLNILIKNKIWTA